MRKAIKIINIITMIVCALVIFGSFVNCWVSFIKTNEEIPLFKFIPTLLLLIPIVVCNLTNEKVEFALSAREFKVFWLITLIGGNIISGLLMLYLYKAETKNDQPAVAVEAVAEEVPVAEEVAEEVPVEE